MTHLQEKWQFFPTPLFAACWLHTKVFVFEKKVNRGGPSTSRSRGTKATKGGEIWRDLRVGLPKDHPEKTKKIQNWKKEFSMTFELEIS